MIHFNTKNESFKKMSYLLDSMGIKNSTFFLELKDETLKDIDPLDEENLTKEQKVRIHNEIARNPFYFLREVVRIPSAGSKSPFELTRATLAIVWSVLLDISSFVILPRQSYKTYTAAAIYVWFFYWGCKDTEFTFFSYVASVLKSNLSRVKAIRDNLPAYLNLYDSKRDKDNEYEMRYNGDDFYNWIRIKAPSKSKDEATKIGRGYTTPILWYDEIAFIPNIKEQYESAVYAYKTAARIAKMNNTRYHRLMTTTPGYLDTEEGNWTYNFIDGSCEFDERFYDYDVQYIKEIIEKNSNNGFLHIEYMYYDLGKGDSYLEEMAKDNVSQDSFEREVLLKWGRSGGEHPLGRDTLQILETTIKQPEDIIVIDDVYMLKLYRKIDTINFEETFIAGLDCGGNVLRDFTVLNIVDPSDYSVVGVMRTNSRSTTRFAHAIAHVMSEIFTGLVLVPERNSMGIAIVDSILYKNPQLRRRIYHDKKDLPGFHNTKDIRFLLYNVLLKQSVTDSLEKLHDKNLIREIISLTVNRQGKIDHPSGGHDDVLMAYLFVRWFCVYGHNRSRYVDPLKVGVNVSVHNEKQPNEIYMEKIMSYNNKTKVLFGNEDDSQRSFINPDGTINRNINYENERSEYVGDKCTEDTIDVLSRRYSDSIKGNVNLEVNTLDAEAVEEMEKEEEKVEKMYEDEVFFTTSFASNLSKHKASRTSIDRTTSDNTGRSSYKTMMNSLLK